MKKFLTIITVLTLTLVPFGTTKCMAMDNESSTEWYVVDFDEKSFSNTNDEQMSKGNMTKANKNRSRRVRKTTRFSKSGRCLNSNKKIKSIYGKKKSHKLLFATTAVAATGAGIYAMNKYSANGELAKTLGNATRSTVDFAKDKSNIAANYINMAKDKTYTYITEETKFNQYMENTKEYIKECIEKTPVLNKSIEAIKNYFDLTKGNWNNNVNSFKEAMKADAKETTKEETSSNPTKETVKEEVSNTQETATEE